MKTIKIIDLLNKIANGEELPKEIKYYDTIITDIPYFMYEKMGKCSNNTMINFFNEEAKIIEEKKIPKKIPADVFEDYTKTAKVYQLYKLTNEIIDYLESKEKGE